MERLRGQVRRPAAGAAALALCLGAGCIHVHTDAAGKVKSVELKTSSAADEPKADTGVKQAGATIPAPLSLPSLPKLAGFTGPGAGSTAGAGTVILTMFENRVATLPDPTKGGAPTPGLVGQFFLFGAGKNMPTVAAEGSMTFVMHDETTPDKPSDQPLGSWTFSKQVLSQLVTVDERFGRCYALFLPWPDYKPSVTRVRITAKYDAENGPPLIAPPQTVTLDGSGAKSVKEPPPGAFPPVSGFGGPVPPATPPPGGGLPGGQQFGGFGLPIGGPVPPGAAPPGGLPPIAFTAGKR